jgi:hypothetical protein
MEIGWLNSAIGVASAALMAWPRVAVPPISLDGCSGYHHLGGSHDTFAELVTGTQDGRDVALWLVRVFFVGHSLMHVWVEYFTLGANLPHPQPLERARQITINQLEALRPTLLGKLGRDVCERPPQVVRDRQKGANRLGADRLGLSFPLGFHSPFVVQKVGLHPLEHAQILLGGASLLVGLRSSFVEHGP